MRYPATEKLEIIRLVEQSHLPARRTLDKLGIPRATFRRRFLADIERLFVEVLALAREAGMLKLGTVALDGTKVHANASRHSALSYEHASKIEAQLRAEVKELMALAEAADQVDVPDGMSVPEELAGAKSACNGLPRPRRRSRRGRRSALRASRPNIRRSCGRARRRRTRPGASRAAGTAAADGGAGADGPGQSDRSDFRIMPVAGGGFEQAYNAQAAVATTCWWSPRLVQAAMTSSRSRRCWTSSPRFPRCWAAPRPCCGQRLFQRGERRGLRRSRHRAADRLGASHHRGWKERFAAAPPAPEDPTALQAMAHRLATPEGRQAYALRKQTPEPVFGIIKSVMGFRQFHLRGLEKVKGEWNLVTLLGAEN